MPYHTKKNEYNKTMNNSHPNTKKIFTTDNHRLFQISVNQFGKIE